MRVADVRPKQRIDDNCFVKSKCVFTLGDLTRGPGTEEALNVLHRPGFAEFVGDYFPIFHLTSSVAPFEKNRLD
jgi:hypothetical protein